jgi:MFS family permease
MPQPATRGKISASIPGAISDKGLRLGLRENLEQFVLLAAMTLGVGLVIGAERVAVPALATSEFHVASFLATLSFIVSFGVVKALLNLVAGRLADRIGRKPALLYPTLLAAGSDVAHPRWRGASLGVYRLWCDSGYAIGGLAIGLVADAFGLLAGFWFCAALMALSGLVVALAMYETQPARRTVHPAWERDPRLG